MSFASWSIRNPIPSILLFILLSLAGLRGLQQLSIQSLPDLDLPSVIVKLNQPGAAPAQLETEVARKVEDSIATLSGLKHIRTSITDGLVQINVEFILEKKLSDALIETKDAVDRVRSDLPTSVLQPSISAVTVGGAPILTYAIASTKLDEEALSWRVDDNVSKAMLGVAGVGRFERLGGVQREIQLEVDPVRLASLGVTATDVSRALKQVQQESSGGRGNLGLAEQSVRTLATVRQAQELAALPVAIANGREVRLDQIATVRDTVAERTQLAALDGKPLIGFNIYRAKGFDETRIANDVEQALARMREADPSLSFTLISGSVAYSQEQYEGSMMMLYEGALLAVLVVWWFLRDWRATLVSASALPLSILPTFAVMHWLGFSLNMLTMLALAIVVGILVDDAIVEIENIARHVRMGKSIRQAAAEAVDEIALAVIATTLTLVVVFMPTALMSGVSGLFFRQFGWTAVVAVLASLLVARLLTPMLAAYLLTEGHHPASVDGRLMPIYLQAVQWTLQHRQATMLLSTLFFIGACLLLPLIPAGFVPPADRGYTTVQLELPPGSSINDAGRVAEAARTVLQALAGVEHIFTAVGSSQIVGGGVTRPGEQRKGALTLTLSERGQRPHQSQIEQAVRAVLRDVPGARFSIGIGGPGEKMSLILSSDNAGALKASAQALERDLRTVGTLSSISSTASLERPEIAIRPDWQRAAELGVTAELIGETVRIATSGDFDAQLAKLNLDNRQLAIRVRIADAARQDLQVLANLRVRAGDKLVPLSSVAELSLASGSAQVDRYDRRRYVTVNAELGGMSLGEALAAAKTLPAVVNMPSSVKLIRTGDAEIMAELVSSFGMAMLTGLLCVFCVLVLLFKDFFQPLTILSAIPLSMGGAFIALLLTGGELNIPSMIGLIMLMGIVTKNSILLVEYALLAIREHGLSRHEALLDACHKRARPIVMTTVAMIAGMLPIALGWGADASFRQPMAVAVIGGLISSTLLSLLVVPVVFTYVDGARQSLVKQFFGSVSKGE
ncbi:efflux RND transporter permease subunit [Methylomonas sp. MO1]|uniref:efflux RND transporter permease subunit n=1 Tax=Methylomonas sp. MO1 TaxID=3073619 RepID=UPI0028A50A8A|nr:efflux RND transporter permease subunit [Methylomonas sp. MO1]MDT4289291.1 efflux RND transporter permease subunit [Methylomonas sp. MO1]